MAMRILWAYLADISPGLLLRSFPELKVSELFETEGWSIRHFTGNRCRASLETARRPAFPIEVEISLDDGCDMQIADDNVGFGEWLVDRLACTAFVDCGGRYNPVFSDALVRITLDKMESIAIPEDGAMIDETKTTLIKRRP